MKKRILLTLILILNISFFSVSNSFSSNEESTEKIKKISDIKNDIRELEADKKHSKFVFDSFMKLNWKVKSFLKEDISKEDLSNIYLKIREYDSLKKNNANNKKLLKLREDFYLFLEKYISDDKIELFNNFVEKDLSRLKKDYKISSNIKENNIVLDKKVNLIKWEIIKNQIKLNSKLENVLENKIRLKFLIFKNSKKISSISVDRKKKIFNSVLIRIQNKIEVIDPEKNIKKMRTYKIVEKILLENILELEQLNY